MLVVGIIHTPVYISNWTSFTTEVDAGAQSNDKYSIDIFIFYLSDSWFDNI